MIEIIKNQNLQPFNTFGIKAQAEYFVEIHSKKDLVELLEDQTLMNEQKLILGGGSNILFTKDYHGVILKNNIMGIDEVEETSENTLLRVGAGENWHKFVLYCVDKNLGGIENLSLIPGCVGAAPVQNIGAYGVEQKETFSKLEAIDLKTGKIVTFNQEECKFGYRDSIFKNEAKGKYLITHVYYKLNKNPQTNISYGNIESQLNEMNINPQEATIKDVSLAVIKIRESKLPNPVEIGNGGSFFKNPVVDRTFFDDFYQKFNNAPYFEDIKGVKIPAAWLIDQCGWKGKKVGKIGVHKNQPLVLVNYGGGTGEEIKKLSEEIQKSVADKFNIHLEAEVNII